MQLSNQAIKIFNFLKKPYIIIVAFFVIWMLFFDQKNVFIQWENYSHLQKLKKSIRFYQSETQKNYDLIYNLEHNPQFLEKFAREQYYFKKPNEDIYLIKTQYSE